MSLGQVAFARTVATTPKPGDDRVYVALEHMAQGAPVLLGSGRAGDAVSNKTVFRAGDVLIGKLRPNLGKAVRTAFDGVCSTDILAVVPGDDLDGGFLLQAVHGAGFREYATATAAGTKMPRTSWKALAAFEMRLPPLPEQRAIAAALSAVDEAIAAGEGVVEHLNRLKRDLAEDLLRHGLPNRHRGVQRSEVIHFPATWRVAPLSEVVAGCDYGLSCSMSLDAAGVACLRMGNIQEGEVRLDDLKYVTLGEAEPRLLLKAGDVLFNRTNSKDLVGKVGVFRGDPKPVTFASYLLRLQPKPDVAGGEWLGLVLNTEPYQRHIRSMATPGISQVNVNRTRLLELPVPIPTRDEQHAIVDVVRAVAARIEYERAAVSERRRLKAALADALLTGKIRVQGANGV